MATKTGGPKPRVQVVERNFHATLATSTGDREIVLSLMVPYKRFRELTKMSTDSALDDFETFVLEVGSGDALDVLHDATDTIEVLAVAQLYFAEFQHQADARMGELGGSSRS